MRDADIEKVLVSNRISFGKKNYTLKKFVKETILYWLLV